MLFTRTLVGKLYHLTAEQAKASQKIQELQETILRMSNANQAVKASIMAPQTDISAQSVDSMLADEEGQELEHELPEVQQLPEIQLLSIDKVFEDLEETIQT